MKNIMMLVLVFVLLLLFCMPAFAQQIVAEELVQEAPMTMQEFQSTGLQEWFSRGMDVLKDALQAPLRLCTGILSALVLAALVRSTAPSGMTEGSASIIDTVVAATLFVFCAPSVSALMDYAQEAFSSASQYLTTFVPVFAGVVAACGQAGSATIYTGLFFTATMTVSQLYASAGVSFLRMVLSLCAVGCIESGVDADSLARQLSKWLKWCLAAGATVFTALLGMQSIFAQSADSFALKTGKLVVSSSIPVVGKAMSDALGTVLAGLHLMKATVGFAVIAVTAAAFVPILTQCAVYQAVFAVSRAVAAALGITRCVRLLDGVSQCVGLCMAMCALFGFMVLSATILMVLLGSG